MGTKWMGTMLGLLAVSPLWAGGSAGTVGVGFGLQGLDVDYALVTQGDFDASHRISVGCRF
jgi:hypothetical protein